MRSSITSNKMRVVAACFLSITLVGELSYYFQVRSTFFSFTQTAKSVERIKTDYQPQPQEILKTNLSSSGASSRTQNLTLETTLNSNQTEKDHWPQVKIEPSPNGTQNLTSEPIASALEFEREQWPRLQRKLCPNGVPNLKFGPSLFKLGRKELGIKENSVFKKPKKEHQLKPNNFFDEMYEVTTFIDGHDPDNSLLYPSIWKCGNNQVHSYLELVINRDEDGNVKDKNSAFGHQNDKIVWRQNRVNFKRQHPGYGWGDSHEKPCIFTTIRDPIGRVLSGYNEIEWRLTTGMQLTSTIERMDIPPYTAVPPYPLNSTEPKPTEEVLEIRFRKFVSNLVREHPSITKMTTVYRHIHPMSKILSPLKRFNLLPSDNGWLLPLNAEITKTFPKFLNERCPRLSNIYHANNLAQSNRTNEPEEFPGFPDMPVAGQHESSTDPFGTYNAAKSVFSNAGPTTRALCSVYAFDYACFYTGNETSSPFSAVDIPEICREVYASDMFQNEIFDS